MVRVFVMALLLCAGSIFYSVPAEAAPVDGPKLKGLFQKKGKAFKKAKKTKYHHAAAKKHRRAQWQQQRQPMVP